MMSENRSYRILVVDDEKNIRDSLAEFLMDYGLEVTAVSSAEQGLELLKEEFFDLSIVDIRLPDQDGDQFMLQAHQLQPRMRFIVHTGSVHYQIRPELQPAGLGSADIFLKPVFNLTTLYERVLALLQEENTHG